MDARRNAIASELTDVATTTVQTGLLFAVTFGVGVLLADVARERVILIRDDIIHISRNVRRSRPGGNGCRSLRDGPLASLPGESRAAYYVALGANTFWEVGKVVAPGATYIALCGMAGMILNRLSRSSSESLAQNLLRSARYIGAVKRGDI